MSEIDYNRIGVLLHIVEKVSTVCPQYTSLSSAAMAELKEINQAVVDAGTAGKAPPTQPLAPQAPTEPSVGGTPTNELGTGKPVTLQDVKREI